MDYFKCFTIMLKAAINNHVQALCVCVSVCGHIFSIILSKYRGVKLLQHVSFNFMKTCQEAFQGSCTILSLPPAMHESSSCSKSLPILGILNSFNFTYLSESVSHCGFNLYIFFGEVCVQIF